MSVSPSAAPSVSDGDSLPPLSAPVSAEPSPKRHGHRHEREEPNGKPGTIAEARTWLIFPGWTISEGFKNNPLTSMIQFNDYLVERPDFRWNSESYLSVPSPRPGNSTPWPLTHTWRCPPQHRPRQHRHPRSRHSGSSRRPHLRRRSCRGRCGRGRQGRRQWSRLFRWKGPSLQ